MNSGFGTDLFAAYAEPESVDPNNFDYERKVSNSNSEHFSNSDSQPQPQQQEQEQQQQQHQQHQQQQHSQESQQDRSMYNQSELLQDISDSNLKSQMTVLKKEIAQQKKADQVQYKDSFEQKSLLETIFHKKREMIRFFSISLIIIFALSTHQIISDVLLEYLDNTNISKNKEVLIKCAYPLCIFILAWIIKVVSK